MNRPPQAWQRRADAPPQGRLRPVVAAAALVLVSSLSRPAASQSPDECVDAHLRVQSLRRSDQLLEARTLALTCVQHPCPPMIRTDCGDFLRQIEFDLPSVGLRALDEEGNDLIDVTVSMDGKVLTKKLQGRMYEVDPGPHVFRFEIPGREPIERTVILHKGARNKLVQVALKPKVPPRPPAGTGAAEPKRPEPRESEGPDGVRVAGYLLGAVGLVGLGFFVAFGVSGLSERSDLEGCSPNCPDDRIDPVRTKLIAADVSLGIGAAALAAGVVLVAVSFSGDTEEQPADAALRFGVSPTPGGGVAQLSAAF